MTEEETRVRMREIETDGDSLRRKYNIIESLGSWAIGSVTVAMVLWAFYTSSDTRLIIDGYKKCPIVYKVGEKSQQIDHWIDKNETCPKVYYKKNPKNPIEHKGEKDNSNVE